VGGKLPPFPPGYSPGGNRILMAYLFLGFMLGKLFQQ